MLHIQPMSGTYPSLWTVKLFCSQFHVLRVGRVVRESHTNKQFSMTVANCPIIQFWHYLPQNSIRFHRVMLILTRLLSTSDTNWKLLTELIRGSHGSLLWFQSFAIMDHRTQRSILLTRLHVYYKNNSQGKIWERGTEFSCLL